MTDQVTVSNDRGDQKTLKGAKARKVKAGVQRHLKRGTAAPIKPGKHMTSRRGRAPQKGGVELPAGDVSIDASTELVRGARLALAERILGEMYGGIASSIKDPIQRDDAEFEAGRMNKKAQRALTKKRISKKADAQAKKIIQGDDPEQPTLSGGSRPWNKPLT